MEISRSFRVPGLNILALLGSQFSQQQQMGQGYPEVNPTLAR